MATDETMQTKGNVPTGHPIGFWFFFWGEFAERASFYGMRAILALYFTERLGFTQDDGASFVSLFIAACYFAPIVGGLIADNYLGKYWTIVGFSGPYILGHVLVGIENDYFVFGALALLAMGSGVIKPNISALMGMTYDQQRPGQTQLRSDAFSWFYLAINIGAFLSQLAVPWVRTNYSYQLAFLFPAILMVVSFAIFAMGKRFYAVEVIERPQRTPEEAAKDWQLKMVTLGRIGSLFFLIMFFWAIFDQSASTWIYFADTYMNLDLDLIVFQTGFSGADAVQAVNAFFIMTLLPIFVFIFNRRARAGKPILATSKISTGFILCGLSMVILGVSGFLAGKAQEVYKITTNAGVIYVEKSDKTLDQISESESELQLGSVALASTGYKYDEDKKKGKFENGTLSLSEGAKIVFVNGAIDFDASTGLDLGAKLAAPGVLEAVFKEGKYLKGGKVYEVDDEGNWYITGKEPAQKPTTSESEKTKKEEEKPAITIETSDWVPPAERVTIWWQILAYFVLTCSEILISVTGLELAYVAAPDSMKGFVTALWLATVGMANLAINVPFTRLYSVLPPGWYFMTMAIALGVVFVLFLPIASRFNRAMDEQAQTEIRKGDTDAV